METPIFHEGVLMGYTDGQNGSAWPNATDPLSNSSRAGFYISQLRLNGELPFDSTFSAVFAANFIAMDPAEAYLRKRFGLYTFKLGKFRVVGPKSGPGTDEFERTAITAPRYSRYWASYAQTLNFRDFGVQAERTGEDGSVHQAFCVRNGTQQNIINDEPSFPQSAPTQALAFAYALDWRVSPFTVLGGHVEAVANHQWDEFVGNHDGWQVGYWFKSNAIVDASVYHQMDFTKVHLFNEALLLYNRLLPSPTDGKATQLWGVSSMIRVDHSERWGYFFRYEFLDPSDGFFPNDNLHMFTGGVIYKPSPQAYPGLKVTGEYVRSLEESLRNRMGNDNLYVQLQMTY